MVSNDVSLSQDLSGGDVLISPLSIDVADSPPKNEIRLELQRYRHRQWLFVAVCVICGSLYAIFFMVMWALAMHTIMLQMFLAHKHIIGLVLALLLVPSAMLWGLVRAVFKVEIANENYADMLKECFKIHPSM